MKQFGEIVIADELDPLFRQRVTDALIAQRAQLCLALDAVGRGVFRINMSWVTAQLCDSFAYLGPDH